MSSYPPITDFLNQALLAELQERGMITGTFLRLSPARREAVVGGILEEAALKGPTKINIKEVACRAGVSIGSLYQYFGQRQGLLDFTIEIITRQIVEFFKYIKPYFKEISLRDALKAYFEGGIEMIGEYRGYIQYFTRAAYQGDPVLVERVVRPVAKVMLEMTREILNRAKLRGEIHPDIDIEAATRLVNTMIIAVYDAQFLPHLNTYYQLTDKKMTRERIINNMLSLVENALKK
jgi:TetR/AcrR family transcriptional regulator